MGDIVCVGCRRKPTVSDLLPVGWYEASAHDRDGKGVTYHACERDVCRNALVSTGFMGGRSQVALRRVIGGHG